MRGKPYTEEQIVKTLKEGNNVMKTAEICRLHEITEQMFYRWKAKYGGMEVSDTRRL